MMIIATIMATRSYSSDMPLVTYYICRGNETQHNWGIKYAMRMDIRDHRGANVVNAFHASLQVHMEEIICKCLRQDVMGDKGKKEFTIGETSHSEGEFCA